MAEILEQKLSYTGNIQPKLGELDSINKQPIYPYLPTRELIESVNISIYLERPLLLKGEPGCGKTRLARAVAYELNLPFESWYIKSTSKAQDGLYIYDAISRLRDAQLDMKDKGDGKHKFENPENYIRWGPLGKAFRCDERTVVLIDEIDKADIDFPNDLLLELEERSFIIEETGERVFAKNSPIVFITSNDEKDLPDAFLRRCLFQYIDFPNQEQLKKIIHSRFPTSSDSLIKKAIERFTDLRQDLQNEGVRSGKNVSTSELIDWFKVLNRNPEDEILSVLEGKLPFLGVLLKNWEDHMRYLRRIDD